MAAPSSAVTFTDDELRGLVGKITPEEIDALSDDEVKRLDALSPGPGVPFSDPKQEAAFRKWNTANNQPGIDPNPDNPEHHYDYRAAYLAGAKPDPKTHHWPSEFKTEGHPRSYMSPDGKSFSATPVSGWTDTRTMVKVPDTTQEAHSVPHDPTYRDPFAGKPTLAEFERNKTMTETPRMSLPTGRTQTPPLPQEGPTDLKSFLLSIGTALTGGGDRPKPDQGFVESIKGMFSEKPAPSSTEVSDPNRIATEVKAQQASLIGANQPMQLLAGASPSFIPGQPEIPLHVAAKVAPAIIKDVVESASEFLLNPARQLAERPVEFGANVLQAGLWLHGARAATAAAKAVPEAVAAAEAAIKAAAPRDIMGAQAVLESKLDEIARAKDVSREMFGGDQEWTNRLRSVETQIKAAQQTIAEAHGPVATPPKPSKFQVGESVEHVKSGKTYEVTGLDAGPGGKYVKVVDQTGEPQNFHPDWLKPASPPPPSGTVTDATETALATTKLPKALALTGPGAVLLKGAVEDDKEDPTPRVGGPFGVKHPILTAAAVGGAGILGYGAFRYFKAVDWPAFLSEAKVYTRFDKSREQDLYKLFETAIAPIFPDTPAGFDPAKVKAVATIGGAVAGGYVAGQFGRDEPSGPMTLLGAAVGAATGSIYGRNIMHAFTTEKTWRDFAKLWFKEGGLLPEEVVAEQRARRVSKEGVIREIKDVTEEATKFSPEIKSKMQAYMAGNLSAAELPEDARWSADKMRIVLDELTLGAINSGAVTDPALKEVYVKNLGTYIPRLLLRYEIADLPQARVDRWLQSSGKGWGYFSTQDYNKLKKDVPQDILDAYQEIKANPAYLLAKRGTIVAADIENARYQKFILSSPDYSIPEDVLGEGKKAHSAYKKLLKEDLLANKADLLTRKQNVGEIPETNYSPELAREAQQKAAAQIGPKTVARSYEYLSPDNPHPKFMSGADGNDVAEWNGQTYWKIPENARYGQLKGQYVEARVASDMMGLSETVQGLSNPLLSGILSSWKFTKAVFNFASLFRNNVSNVIFADLKAGIGSGPWNWARWTRGFNDVARKTKWYERAVKDGAFGGEFTKSEMLKYLEPEVAASSDMMDFVGRSIPAIAQKVADFPADKAIQYHQFSEAWARMTVYRKAVEKLGMKGPEAAAFARRAIPDYQDVPRWVQVARRSVFGPPFVSFAYKAIPPTLESAFAFGDPKKAFGFWKYPLAMAAVNEYAAQKFGMLGKGEQVDTLSTIKRLAIRTLGAGFYQPEAYNTFQKYLPQYVGNLQIWIPARDHLDRPAPLDGTYFLNWGDAGQMGTGQVGTASQIPFLPSVLEPSNPMFQLGVAAVTGKDSFSGKDIVPPGALGPERMAYWGQFLMRSMGPSLAPGAGYGATSLQRSLSGDYASDPNVKTPLAAVAAEIGGARTRPVDPGTAIRFKVLDFKDKLDKNRSVIMRLARGLSATTELTPQVMADLLANHPSNALVREIENRKRMIQEFQEKYKDVPPSPQKLIDAMKRKK